MIIANLLNKEFNLIDVVLVMRVCVLVVVLLLTLAQIQLRYIHVNEKYIINK